MIFLGLYFSKDFISLFWLVNQPNFIKNYQSNICCWINPIAPLQSSEDIVRTIKYFIKNKLDSLITVENKMVHVNYNKKPINYNKKEKFQQTQDLESIDLFSYTIMMWNSKKFLSNMLKNKYAFFSTCSTHIYFFCSISYKIFDSCFYFKLTSK